ncbi:unnamed protein product [Closterium sp. Yama58-4]|nr:unnamed protein product [Closterium sp. Yama58-4]
MRCGLSALLKREASPTELMHLLIASAPELVTKLVEAAASNANNRTNAYLVRSQVKLHLDAQRSAFRVSQRGANAKVGQLLGLEPQLGASFPYKFKTVHISEHGKVEPDDGFSHGGDRRGPAYRELLASVREADDERGEEDETIVEGEEVDGANEGTARLSEPHPFTGRGTSSSAALQDDSVMSATTVGIGATTPSVSPHDETLLSPPAERSGASTRTVPLHVTPTAVGGGATTSCAVVHDETHVSPSAGAVGSTLPKGLRRSWQLTPDAAITSLKGVQELRSGGGVLTKEAQQGSVVEVLNEEAEQESRVGVSREETHEDAPDGARGGGEAEEVADIIGIKWADVDTLFEFDPHPIHAPREDICTEYIRESAVELLGEGFSADDLIDTAFASRGEEEIGDARGSIEAAAEVGGEGGSLHNVAPPSAMGRTGKRWQEKKTGKRPRDEDGEDVGGTEYVSVVQRLGIHFHHVMVQCATKASAGQGMSPEDVAAEMELCADHYAGLHTRSFKQWLAEHCGPSQMAPYVRGASNWINESFHSLITKYAPKRIAFLGSMEPRVALTVLHWNSTVDRVVKEWRVRVRKATRVKRGKMDRVLGPMDWSWVEEVLERWAKLRESGEGIPGTNADEEGEEGVEGTEEGVELTVPVADVGGTGPNPQTVSREEEEAGGVSALPGEGGTPHEGDPVKGLVVLAMMGVALSNERDEYPLVRAVSGQARAVSGLARAVKGQARAVSGQARAVSGQVRVVSGHARAVSGLARAVSGLARAVSGQVRAVSGQVRAVSGQVRAVSGQARAVSGQAGAVKGQARAVSGQARAVSGQVRAVSGQVRAVSGQVRAVSGQVRVVGGHARALSGPARALSGQVRAVSGQVRVVSGHARAVSGLARAVSGLARAVSGQVRAVSGQVRAVSGQVRAVSGQARAVSGQAGAVKGQARAVSGQARAVSGQARAVSGQVRAVSGQVRAVSGQVRAVSGQVRAVSGHARAVRGQVRAVSGQVRAVSGQARAVSGLARAVSVLARAVSGQVRAVSGQVRAVSGQVRAVSGQVRAVSGLARAVSVLARAVSGQVRAVSGQFRAVSGQVRAVSGQAGAVSGHVRAVSGQVRVLGGQVRAVSGQVRASGEWASGHGGEGAS